MEEGRAPERRVKRIAAHPAEAVLEERLHEPRVAVTDGEKARPMAERREGRREPPQQSSQGASRSARRLVATGALIGPVGYWTYPIGRSCSSRSRSSWGVGALAVSVASSFRIFGLPQTTARSGFTPGPRRGDLP